MQIQPDNIRLKNEFGTSPTCTIGRLKRDEPDIAVVAAEDEAELVERTAPMGKYGGDRKKDFQGVHEHLDDRGSEYTAARINCDHPEIAVVAAEDAAELVERTAPIGRQGRPKKTDEKPDHDQDLSRFGTDPEYIAARINRDNPDIAARTKAGEFPSMRQAGIAAGSVHSKPLKRHRPDVPERNKPSTY